MGLDVSFYADAEMVHEDKHPRALGEPKDSPGEECWDHFTVLWISDFPDQADGLPHNSCWKTGERQAHIHHSYGGYSRFRAWLSMGALKVDPEKVWADPDKYAGAPFYEQINFADNEGTIGPKTAAKLAEDYRQHRQTVVDTWRAMPRRFDEDRATHESNIEYEITKYDEWAAAFALVTDNGFVVFS